MVPFEEAYTFMYERRRVYRKLLRERDEVYSTPSARLNRRRLLRGPRA